MLRKKEFHVDSTASAVATGVVQGISDAAKIASSIGEVSYDLNSAERAQRIKDDGFKLEQANAEIKTKSTQTIQITKK